MRKKWPSLHRKSWNISCRTLSWERNQGYGGLNSKIFGLLCPLLCHWRPTLIRGTKQNWSFTRVIASRSCVWYLNRPWYVKICRQNQTHYNLTLKILSPFSFQPRLTCDGLNQYGTRLGRFATVAVNFDSKRNWSFKSIAIRVFDLSNPNPS